MLKSEFETAKKKRDDKILKLFLREMQEKLGAQLKQIILFGSRARGDFVPDSDYDCLAIVDEPVSNVKDTIDQIAGDLLFEYNAVLSVFPVSEEAYRRQTYNPLFMNVRQEGIELLDG